MSAVVRGVVIEMPELMLDATKAIERISRKVLGFEEEVGPLGEFAIGAKESLEDFRAEHPILRPSADPGWLEQGFESFATSIGAGAPGAAAGFGIGSLGGPFAPITGPMGAIIGFALSGGITFGLSEYQNVIDMADEQGIPRSESEPAAVASGVAEGGFEFASDLLTAGILKIGSPLTAPAREGFKNGIRQLFKVGFKEAALRSGAVIGSETSMEMITAGIQAEQYKKIGLGDMEFWGGVKEAFGPAFVASVLFAGVGTGAASLHRRSLRRSIESGAVDQERRLAAANQVENILRHVDNNVADVWRDNAYEAIQNNDDIDIENADLITLRASERAAQRTPEEEITPEDISLPWSQP